MLLNDDGDDDNTQPYVLPHCAKSTQVSRVNHQQRAVSSTRYYHVHHCEQYFSIKCTRLNLLFDVQDMILQIPTYHWKFCN